MMLAFMLAANNISSRESIQNFEDLLSDKIRSEVESNGFLYLSCDYHPDYILAETAKKAGVSDSGFPWKTNMRISANEVSVSKGIGAPWVKLFANAVE